MGKRILVAGVGGVLGRELVDAFLAHSIQPAGLELSERGFSGLDGKLSFKVVADVTRPRTLKGALAGIRPFSFQHYALGKLFVFFSINSVPTQKRGKTHFHTYLEQYYGKKG
jgi:nucleoside-diphosphate-sugar epimerase